MVLALPPIAVPLMRWWARFMVHSCMYPGRCFTCFVRYPFGSFAFPRKCVPRCLAFPLPAIPLMSSYQCVPRWFALPPIAVPLMRWWARFMVLALPLPAIPLMSAVHSSCFAAHCSAVDEFLSMCAALPCFSVPCNSVDEMMSAVHGSFLYVPWEVLHMFCSLSFRFFAYYRKYNISFAMK